MATVYGTPAFDHGPLTAPTTAKVINVGDFLIYSGNFVVPTAMAAGNLDNAKASAAGIALENNITWDSFGNVITASALKYAVKGYFWVSANFSGQPKLGVPCFPATTGSAVGYPTGLTGVNAKWQTGVAVGAGLGTASGIGRIVGYRAAGNGGTGELLVQYPVWNGYY